MVHRIDSCDIAPIETVLSELFIFFENGKRMFMSKKKDGSLRSRREPLYVPELLLGEFVDSPGGRSGSLALIFCSATVAASASIFVLVDVVEVHGHSRACAAVEHQAA
jgi:hypothetical protein